MVERDDAALRLHRVHPFGRFGIGGCERAEIEKVGRAEHIAMAEEGRDLPPRQQQHPVERALQPAQGIEMRGCIMVGERDEIEAARCRCLDRAIDRAWYLLALLRQAFAVAVAAVHVQIAAIPARRRV